MTRQFIRTDTLLPGLVILERRPLVDPRGSFERLYCYEELREAGIEEPIRQINRSATRHRGMVRGMHFQWPPHAEVKIVTCLSGRIYDVAVDIRRGSPTFLHYHAVELSEDNHRTVVIPRGFAHGFQTLADDCHMLYLHTADYAKEAEGGIHPGDPALAIPWPEPIRGLSERDAALPMLTAGFAGVRV